MSEHGPIMHCIVTNATGMYLKLPKSILRYTFLILDTYHTGTLYLRKDVRIRGYFLKANGPASKKVWETLV